MPGPNTSGETPPIRERMRRDLTRAMRDQDGIRVQVLRTALAAIENAEAVAPVPPDVIGNLGYGDVARRSLTLQDIVAVLETEVTERETMIAEYERIGQHERAGILRSETRILRSYL